MKIAVTVLASAVLIIVTTAVTRSGTGDSCKLGNGFLVLPDGLVETEGGADWTPGC